MVGSVSRVAPLRFADIERLLGVLQRLADGGFLHGAERHVLRADQATDQHQPAGEHDGLAAAGLGSVELLPAVAERAEGQWVDSGGESVADDERLHAQRAAQRLVLVLGVAEDEGAVAVGQHAQREGLDCGGLASAGLTEDHDVRVGDRDVVVGDPADRIAVERPARQQVDAHLRARRR